jgi:hypothetical protein
LKKLFFALFIFVSFNILAEESGISWDVLKGMNDFIYKKQNVELITLQKIPSYYEIKRKTINEHDKINMKLSFEKNKEYDDTGNYKFNYNKFRISENITIQGKSGYFVNADDRIELNGGKNSIFQSGVITGSFTIDFWMYPVHFSNNDVIFRVGSHYFDRLEDKVEEQAMSLVLNNGKLIWEFTNIFESEKFHKDLIKLESFDIMMPEKWSHVNLGFDSYSGVLTMTVDGKEVSAALATVDGSRDSSVLNLKFNQANKCDIKIAPSFYGALDEFYILNDSLETSSERYDDDGGVILSNVIELEEGGVYISKITPSDTKKNNTDILYYYRYSDSPFAPEEEFSKNIKWHILGTENPYSSKVRFIQWKIMFLPGNNSDYSPRFRGLAMVYDKNLPPSKPAGIKFIAGDGKVRIKWMKNSEKDIKGYKIYYGRKSGYYFGKDASEGASPIDIGLKNEVEITGLRNNVIYYFTITAYDDENKTHESEFSDEVIVRPLEKYSLSR